jgi:type IV pilus assembly protein PilC
MKFNYLAFDKNNQTQKGTIEAKDLREATKLLIEQGWFIKRITPRGRFKSGFTEFSIGRVSLMEKVLFAKHLGVMLKSGINLNEALEVISEQSTSKTFGKVINNILENIKKGQSLGSAMSRHPKVFDSLFVNIVKVGEESGTLEENLNYLTNELEERLELRRNVKAAAFYPAIVLSSTFGLGFILAYFVLPKITDLFKSLSFELPFTTKILLWVAEIMEKHGLFIFGGVVLSIIILRALTKQKFFKRPWHWFLIKMPILGNIIINYNLVLINRTLAILLKSGLTIDQGIEIAIQTTNNVIYQNRLKRVLPQVQKGNKFSDAIAGFKQSKRKPLFPLLTIKMIGVGERSGRMDESFGYLSEYFGKEVDNSTKNLTTVLEPLLLIFVGLVVGFIAISVISPIYQITGQFRR